MANENPNPVVAYVEGRIAAWQAVLSSLKSAMAGEAGGQAIEGMDLTSTGATHNGSIGLPIDLPEGAFLGKSVPVCIKLYLSAARKKKTVKEIAVALREGGVESTSGNFENIVNSSLSRLKTVGEVIRFKDGWGLPEWYPAHIRASAPTASAKRTRKKGKKNERKQTAGKLSAIASGQSVPTKVKASDRVIELLQTKPVQEYSSAEVAKHLGASVSVASMILGQLRKSGKIKMSAPGMYAIVKPQLMAVAQG